VLDPAILADVHYALKMKARREARVRAIGPIRTDTSPQSFFSDLSSPSRAPVPPGGNVAFPSIGRTDTGDDFVASLDASVPHPMPRSLDNGATLDWSGKEITDEPRHDRKWSLSINKRKTKDKATSISSLDHSSSGIPPESTYDGMFRLLWLTHIASYGPYLERVIKVRASMRPQTSRKASVIAEHIHRRYSFLYASLLPPSRPLNLLSIARWNAEQDSAVCIPFSTQRMSDARPLQKSNIQIHSLWYITPSIVEEYLKVQAHQLEAPAANLDSLLPSPMPNGASPQSEEEALPPRNPRAQAATSRKTRATTTSPASDNWPSDSPRPWISSQSENDSPRSSLYGAFRDALGRVSPASGRRHTRDRILRRLSDDSAHASLSETNSQVGSASPTKSRRHTRLLCTPNLDTRALHNSGPESDGGEQHATDMRSPQLSDAVLTAKPPDSTIPSAATVTKSADPTNVPPIRRPPSTRRRMSLPFADYRLSTELEKRRELADEEREQYEYEIRAQYVTHSPSRVVGLILFLLGFSMRPRNRIPGCANSYRELPQSSEILRTFRDSWSIC
jgi:hypothetical protein